MRTLSGILFALFFWGTFSVSAQKSTIYNSNSKDFETAVSLYTAGQYASAKYFQTCEEAPGGQCPQKAPASPWCHCSLMFWPVPSLIQP